MIRNPQKTVENTEKSDKKSTKHVDKSEKSNKKSTEVVEKEKDKAKLEKKKTK